MAKGVAPKQAVLVAPWLWGERHDSVSWADAQHDDTISEDGGLGMARHAAQRREAPVSSAAKPGRKVPADRLGLSPEDAEAVAAAQLRSNRRVWDTLRPLCLQIVGKADVV